MQQDEFRYFLIEEECEHNHYMAKKYIAEARIYLNLIDSFICERESAELAELSGYVSKLESTQHTEFWMRNYPSHWDEIFRHQLYSSYLINMMAFTESAIKESCKAIAIIQNTSENPDNWKNNILKQARKFLKSQEYASKSLEKPWEILYKLYDIRNIFIHTNGYLENYRNAKDVEQFIKTRLDITHSNGFIKIEQGFSTFVIDTVEHIITGLHEQLCKICRNAEKVWPFPE